tara:strand:- start:1431 stop:2294 length:864 start_codon:yes stop_codon:yes gene_type:complete
MTIEIKPFFHLNSNTFCYVVFDKSSNKGAVIDSCLDFDVTTGKTNKEHADLVISYIEENNISIEWILETHVHADHLSAAPYIRDKLGGQIGIGSRVKEIQHTFGEIYNAEKGFKRDGSQFDKLFNDGESFYIGKVLSSYISTPGHTPACGCYKVEDNIFVGDTLFMPDFGTARCDFPGGDARTMYKSIKRILEHHSQTVLWMCHDYLPNGRSEYQYRTTVGAQRENNPHVNDNISEDTFVQLREKKDSLLGFPKLLIPSIQVNMRAGDLPPKEENGTSYIKIPINKI